MTTQTEVKTYAIDVTHSTAEFSVKHMMISTVKGRFREFEGRIRIAEDAPEQSSVEASLSTASVDTGLELRDNDLRSDNFFNAERFPTLTFRSTGVVRVDNDNWRVTGDLTIRDVTREVVLETEFEGRIKDPMGKERVGFTAQTKVNRHDYGLSYNPLLEAGGVMVGDKVTITLHIEAIEE